MIADAVRLEHFADQRPDPPVADDDDAAGVVLGRRDQGFGIELARAPPRQRRAEAAERRNRHHRQRDGDEQDRRVGAVDDAAGDRGADHDEGEFAAGAEQQRRFAGDAARRAEQARRGRTRSAP